MSSAPAQTAVPQSTGQAPPKQPKPRQSARPRELLQRRSRQQCRRPRFAPKPAQPRAKSSPKRKSRAQGRPFRVRRTKRRQKQNRAKAKFPLKHLIRRETAPFAFQPAPRAISQAPHSRHPRNIPKQTASAPPTPRVRKRPVLQPLPNTPPSTKRSAPKKQKPQ